MVEETIIEEPIKEEKPNKKQQIKRTGEMS